jgi:hypothetical protein
VCAIIFDDRANALGVEPGELLVKVRAKKRPRR